MLGLFRLFQFRLLTLMVREVNLINIAPVIVLIHVVPITNLVLADLATSGPAVNILGEEQDVEGSYVHNLPEIFTPFGE